MTPSELLAMAAQYLGCSDGAVVGAREGLRVVGLIVAVGAGVGAELGTAAPVVGLYDDCGSGIGDFVGR
jgi:uncharacterized membrane protein|tara:strand:- start:199 stop:405 length:207 start_codon:yes stop_codon:yes gene_type:complete